MLIAFTSLPGFVTMVCRGMPTVWRGRHRLICCWLIFMQAVSPGRKTLEEMARWTPATITAWRFGRLLKAAYGNVHLLVSWLAQDLVATLPAPANGILYLFGDGSHADKRGTKNPVVSPWVFDLFCPSATPVIAVKMPCFARWWARLCPRVGPSW